MTTTTTAATTATPGEPDALHRLGIQDGCAEASEIGVEHAAVRASWIDEYGPPPYGAGYRIGLLSVRSNMRCGRGAQLPAQSIHTTRGRTSSR